MVVYEMTPEQVLATVPVEYIDGKDYRSWLNVSKGLLAWALGTLRLALRETSSFFEMYKHARKDNDKLRAILAEHGIKVPAYDWKLDEDLVISCHATIPFGLWDDINVEKTGPAILTIRSPQQLIMAAKQAAALDDFLGHIRCEFYGKEIKDGGWTVQERSEKE